MRLEFRIKNLLELFYFLMETLAYHIISAWWGDLQTLTISLDILELIEPVLLSVIRHHPGPGALLEHLGTISVRKAFLPLGLVKPKKCLRRKSDIFTTRMMKTFLSVLATFQMLFPSQQLSLDGLCLETVRTMANILA